MNKKNNLTEFSKTIELLEKAEQGSGTSKERIYNRLIYKLDHEAIQPQSREKDGITMKKSSWRTAAVIGGAVICLGGAFSTTSYAQEMFQSIMAKFKVGNLEITQYDKEIPPASTSFTPNDGKSERDGVIELPASAKLTIDEARAALGMNFPAPGWVADYKFENSVLQGTSMVELQYNSGDKAANFLISKGGENGIGTTEEVKTEVINGATVYFANGIVIWEEKGFTVELYSQTDFDKTTLGKIIGSFSVGAPVEPLEADVVKKNVEKSRGAAAASAPAVD
ncbi:hypothetical protein EHV15_13575 [Paenibacillus oralis]|uniref:DUF4367 domain-containing protein n=1 Tax=Paenibacillus oralis TaxID=2490856 RepID=A0A3P3U5J7_9BACL|nr:hypothetical protein [Paenibacillus oralis]RRJ63843.1 hypothetical protein EHV15_13575 [Paenibacillus oralis]